MSTGNERVRRVGWLLIAAFPLLILLVVEGVVRVAGITPAFERDAALPAWLDRNLLAKEARWVELLAAAPRDLRNYYSTYAWDRFLFYRLRPNLEVPLTDVLAPPGIRERTRWVFRTNRLGYPGPERAPGPHPGTFRILCLGDSSTFGWGVESADAYPALLEEELARRHPGLRVEVVNLGVCGYSSFQGKILLEREGLAYRPDVVTISYGSNDWSRVPEAYEEAYRRNAGWAGGVRSLLHASRAYQIYAAFLTRAVRGREAAAARAAAGDPAAFPFNVGPEKSEANLRAMVGAVRAAGADPILVANCVPGDLSGPIRAAAAATGAPLVDTGALLEAAIPDVSAGRLHPAERGRVLAVYGPGPLAEHPGLEVYLADACHPNPVGHRLLAAALAARVGETASFRRLAAAGERGAAPPPSL